MSEIRPDYCIALRMIALQEHHREAQGWLSEYLEGDNMMRAVAVSDYNALLDRCIALRLRAENEKLRAADPIIKIIANVPSKNEGMLHRDMSVGCQCLKVAAWVVNVRIAKDQQPKRPVDVYVDLDEIAGFVRVFRALALRDPVSDQFLDVTDRAGQDRWLEPLVDADELDPVLERRARYAEVFRRVRDVPSVSIESGFCPGRFFRGEGPCGHVSPSLEDGRNATICVRSDFPARCSRG